MSRRSLRIIAINIILFCVLAEVAALAVYYVENGAFFYTHHKVYERIPETAEQRLTREGLHPYFGPTHAPGTPFDIPETMRAARMPARVTTNNFGFVSAHDYPFTKTSDTQFVIGLFGGSVGVWFCQIGAVRLVEDLKKDDFFKGKELVPLCFAHEGYKQPQQLLELAYFLSIGQPFDLVVNIDGFNEVALSALNDRQGFDISMPSAQHIGSLINLVDQATLTPEKLQSLAAIDRDKAGLNELAGRIERNRIAVVNFVLERVYRRTRDQYVAEQGRFANLPSNPSERSLIMATRPIVRREGRALFEAIAAQWADASILMDELLAARRVPYFHVLQPNQYFTTRTFPEDESALAISRESPYKTSVEQGYPFLLKEAESGRLQGKPYFLNAVRVFDGEPRRVYADNCCHYTLLGNEKLADFIAAAIVKIFQVDSAPR
jgi:hypothetical protein